MSQMTSEDEFPEAFRRYIAFIEEQLHTPIRIISIGPDILDIHSPKETLVLQTVYDCDALVRSMLKEIAEEE